jgi:hypothetical protein
MTTSGDNYSSPVQWYFIMFASACITIRIIFPYLKLYCSQYGLFSRNKNQFWYFGGHLGFSGTYDIYKALNSIAFNSTYPKISYLLYLKIIIYVKSWHSKAFHICHFGDHFELKLKLIVLICFIISSLSTFAHYTLMKSKCS